MGIKGRLGWLIIGIFFVLALGLSVVIGPRGFSFQEIGSVIAFRFPRVVVGIVAGGVLAVVGGALQGVLRNPLVDPWTLGVASGATLGASVALILPFGPVSLLLPVAAFSGALMAIVIVYLLARGRTGLTITRLILAGVIVSFFFSSLVMLVTILGGRTLGEAVYIMMGTLSVVFTRRSFWLFILSGVLALMGCGWLVFHSRELDIISLSEETALSLGVDARRLIKMVFLVSSFSVGMVVAWTGAISFIGLVVPHVVRMAFGPAHNRVLPGSFLGGAGLLLFADVLARSIAPGGLPLSVITALVGVPFFIYLLRSQV